MINRVTIFIDLSIYKLFDGKNSGPVNTGPVDQGTVNQPFTIIFLHQTIISCLCIQNSYGYNIGHWPITGAEGNYKASNA